VNRLRGWEMGVVLRDSYVQEMDIGEHTERMGDGVWCSGTAMYKRWILVNRLRGWEMGGGALGQLCIRGGYW